MRLVLLLALALVAPIPVALAQCADPVCVEESTYGPAECTQPGDFGSASTTITAAGTASVTGSSYCYNDFETGEGRGDGISASAAGVTLLWAGFNGGCGIFLYSGESVTSLPCATPPPNPGWGSLLA